MLVPVLENTVVPGCVWSKGPMQAPVSLQLQQLLEGGPLFSQFPIHQSPRKLSASYLTALSAPLYTPAVFPP